MRCFKCSGFLRVSHIDIDRLYIVKVLVGKAFVMKRLMARAKGRGCRILKQFSRLTIVLEER